MKPFITYIPFVDNQINLYMPIVDGVNPYDVADKMNRENKQLRVEEVKVLYYRDPDTKQKGKLAIYRIHFTNELREQFEILELIEND